MSISTKLASGRSLTNEVVVLTGASSGIGRAAAIEFARRGSRLVLAGRRQEALESVAEACRAAGAEAIVCQTDVRSEEQVRALATVALAQTGRIDVWVNNAGVTLFGSLENGPMDEHREVLETNLFGAIYGARAAVPVFRRQRRGVLINVGSILSQIGQPFVPSYVISKFGLRGLTEALRAELADEYDIHVCTLLPYAVDTEHFESGANHIGRSPHALPPTLSPERVGEALVDLAERPRRELRVPRIAVLGLAAHALLPRTVERILLDALTRWHFADERQPPGSGNLDTPTRSDGHVHGERGPLIGTAKLLAFAALRFPVIQLELLLRALGLSPRASNGSVQGNAGIGIDGAARRNSSPGSAAFARDGAPGRSLEARVDEQHGAQG